MKRVTVAITFVDDGWIERKLKSVRKAMVNAAVQKATDEDMEIAAIEARTGHIQNVKRKKVQS